MVEQHVAAREIGLGDRFAPGRHEREIGCRLPDGEALHLAQEISIHTAEVARLQLL